MERIITLKVVTIISELNNYLAVGSWQLHFKLIVGIIQTLAIRSGQVWFKKIRRAQYKSDRIQLDA